MDLSHSEETNELRRAAADFAKHRVAPNIREKDEHAQVDVGLYREMGKEGFLGCCIPAKYGGLGLDYHSLAVASEEFEYIDTSARVVIGTIQRLYSMLKGEADPAPDLDDLPIDAAETLYKEPVPVEYNLAAGP